MALPERKSKLLREFVGNICEECKEPESKCGTLQAHRIQRGYQGGRYILRNIKMVCAKCHKSYHSNEPGIR